MADDEVLTAADVIAQEMLDDIEAEVAMRKCCTYSLSVTELSASGVVGLCQSIYSCLTCRDAQGEYVGVCEPCMLRCHADHEVVEVGTRRQFRCDCPTTKSSVGCRAQPPTEESADTAAPAPFAKNTTNKYGHNFDNKFCSCDCIYDREVDELIQCIACDEWYHPVHLPGKLPSALLSSCDSMICAKCVNNLPFCKLYLSCNEAVCTASDVKDAKDPHEGGKEEEEAVPVIQPWMVCLTCTDGADDGRGVCMACVKHCHAGHVLSGPRLTEFACDCVTIGTCCVPKSDATSRAAAPAIHWCINTGSKTNIASAATAANAAMFLSDQASLTDHLCKCEACMRYYAEQGVATWFFESPEPLFTKPDGSGIISDAAQHADALRAASGSPEGRALLGRLSGSQLASLVPGLPVDFKTTYEQGIDALQALPIARQLDAMHGFNAFSGAFMEWLRQFGAGHVVTAEDVKTFFRQFQDGRQVKPRLE